MRIQEMILREDFYQILKNTVENYYYETTGKQVLLSYDKIEGTRLIINSKLGFISTFPAPAGLRTFLQSEYNIRGGLGKYLAGKLIANGVSLFPQIGKVRDCYITADVINNNSFIYPQNRSVRFFDYENMTVDCAVKSGFTDRYFNNQLSFRKKNNYNFMIPLIKYGHNWFREPIMTGHPLARTTDEISHKNGIRDALKDIGQLSNDSCSEINAKDYLHRLASEIDKKLIEAVQNKCIQTETLVKRLIGAVVIWQEDTSTIPISLSHGDFQEGNIWIDKSQKTWIYDWETVGIRSVWYDPAVLLYSLRRANGWSWLMKDHDLSLLASWCHDKSFSSERIKLIKQTLMIEDILFYLDDLLELPEDWGTKIFDNCIQTIAQAFL